MSLPTCNVLCSIFDDQGQPIQGAIISAKLNQYEVYDGYVVPTLVQGTTGADGTVTIALWPNQLGSTGSMYTIKINTPSGKNLTTSAVIPNVSSTELHLVAELPAYEGKTDGQLILDAAVAAGATAVAKAAEASTSAGAAAASAASSASSASAAAGSAANSGSYASAAYTSADAAINARLAAEASAASALNSSDNATLRAAQSAASATSAAGSVITATTKAGEASSSAAAASASAATATTRATESQSNATASSGSAASSATSAAASAASATSAAASAGSATTQATAASGSASAASSSAGSASGSASAASGSATSAGSSAATASTKAAEAATSATAAATSATASAGSATAAAGSATGASTSADTATTQAGIATTQAGIATTKAGEASASATAGAGSASSALAIYGSTAAMNAAVSTSTTNAATATTKAGEASTSATAAAASAASAAAIVTGVASNRPSVRPSLLIDFAATGKLDPRITFGRSSPAMAYDGKTTVKAEENLVLQSQTFSGWSGNVAVATNTTTAPDGTTTACTITPPASTGTFPIYRSYSSSDLQQTHSFFVKPNGYTKVVLRESYAGGKYVAFDLSNGTIITSVNATGSIVAVGGGWYRITATYTFTGTSWISLYIVSNSYTSTVGESFSFTSDGTSGVFIWGAQAEGRAYATAYTPTTTVAITNYIPALQSYAANVARFDFNPTTGESLGLMVEEQRTNLVSYSQDFDVPTWVKDYSAVQANVLIAPDGTFTADKFVPDATSNYHRAYQAAVSVSGTVGTHSIYAKAGELTKVALRESNTTGNYAVFDLSSGTVIAGYTASTPTITPVGNGWYRIAITATTATQAFGVYGVPNAYTTGAPTVAWTSNAYNGFYIWGAQLEAGAFATSYIPTLLTYSGRGSVATYIGDNGLIQTAAANVARYQRNIAGAVQLLLEGAGTNLLNWSSNFTSIGGWASVTAGNGATPRIYPGYSVSPTGDMSASCLVFNAPASGDQSLIRHGLSISSAAYTMGFRIKAATASDVGKVIVFRHAGGASYATVTLTAVWQFVSSTETGASAYLEIGLRPSEGSSAGTVSACVWGAQLETGSVATSYIPSTETFTGRSGSATYFDPSGVMRTAPSGLARYDFDPVTGLSKGLLVEASAANSAIYSEDLANAAWTATGASVTSNSTVAPDGNTTGDTITFTASATDRVSQSITLTAAAYTISAWAKTASGTKNFRLKYNNGTTDVYSSDFTATTVWTRFTFTVTGTASAGSVAYNNDSAAGAGAIIAWGVQVELGSVATSYIPTTSAPVTRVADTATSVANSRAADVWSSGQATRLADIADMTGTNFSSWYRQDQGTFYSETSSPSGTTSLALSLVKDSNNFISNRSDGSTNKTRLLNFLNGSYVNNTLSGATTQPIKQAFSLKGGSISASANGTLFVTDNTAQIPVGMVSLGIGHEFSNYGNIYIKRLAYYPLRLTNTELQSLTS